MSIQIRSTYDAVYNSMFSEQDNLARSADEPLPIVSRPSGTGFAKRQLLDSATNGNGNADVVVCRKCNCTGIYQGMTEIVQQIRGVLNSNAQADQILGETSSGAGGWVNGRVPVIIE